MLSRNQKSLGLRSSTMLSLPTKHFTFFDWHRED